MPAPSRQSVKAFFSERIEGYGMFDTVEPSLDPSAIEWKLRKFGLDRHEVELLMLRFIDDKSMTDIVKEQGWASINSANYYLKKTLQKLRLGGFKLR